jgi:hypothetical protein
MQILGIVPRLSISVLAVAVIAGCASGASQVTPNGMSPTVGAQARMRNFLSVNAVTTSSFMDSKAVGKPLVFVSDIESAVVNIYLQSGKNKLVGQITGLPRAYTITTDKSANLYVADELGSPYILIYAPPYTGSPTTLDDGANIPSQIGIAADGTIGVANLCSGASCAQGSSSVVFFKPHSTIPCATVPAQAEFKYLFFGGFDAHGDFLTSGPNLNGNTILGEVTGGCKAENMSILHYNNGTGILGGIHAAKNGRVSVIDTAPQGGGTPTIYTYKEPVNSNLGGPVSSTLLDGTTRTNMPTDFAFLASGKSLFVPDSTNGNTNEYAYPAGGAVQRTISLGLGSQVYGIAVTPPLIP